MKSIFISLVAISLLMAAGCSDNGTSDEDKPTITSVNFLNGNSIEAGDSLNIRISFNDNIALSEAFVEVHDNFEGHKHKKVNTKFSASEILTLNGTSDAQVVNLIVPANAAAGPYHVEISALDAEGNRSETKVFALDITQPGQPMFKSMVTELTVNRNADFTIEFEVEDDVDLKEISYVIEDGNNLQDEPLFDGDIDLTGPDDLGFTFKQTFSINKATDEVHFIVRALDSDENLSVAEIEIHVR